MYMPLYIFEGRKVPTPVCYHPAGRERMTANALLLDGLGLLFTICFLAWSYWDQKI